MNKAILLLFCLAALGLNAQVYPFADGFQSYSNFSTLGTQGGYMSDMSVYQTHGMGNSDKGLISQMSNFNTKDSTVSPLIGPLTSSSQVSFFYRIMNPAPQYPFVPATIGSGDVVEIYAGSQQLNVYQLLYTINNSNHNQDTAFKKIKITVPSSFAGQSGNLKIVVRHPANGNDFNVDIDSLVVKDSVSAGNTLSASTSKTNILCNGTCNGTATVSPTGGTTPYTITWSNNLGTGATKNNLCAGTYTVTVTDNASASVTGSVNITEPTAISLSATHTNVSCAAGNDGCINLNANGGTGSFGYAWSNSAATQDVCNLAAGSYRVTVTDGNNCSASITETVTEPSAISLSIAKTNVSCNGGNNACIDLSVTGGTAGTGYIYSWGNSTTTEDICNLTAGTYQVTVTDANGCSSSLTTTVNQPAAISVNTTSSNPTTTGGNDGSITINATGGTSPYNFSVDGGSTYLNSQAFTSLTAGCYQISVKDSLGCIAQGDSVCLLNPTTGIGDLTEYSLNIYPNPASDFIIIANPNLTGAEITLYTLQGAEVVTQTLTTPATTLNVNDLPAGRYALIVKTSQYTTRRLITIAR